jgi:hypothetical protein
MCCKAVKEKHGCGSWTDDTWDLWLRKRIDEIQGWSYGPGEILENAETAILHVFFLTLSETEEMLARLRTGTTKESTVARSKVSKTTLIIHPIDSVAKSVAPEFCKSTEAE